MTSEPDPTEVLAAIRGAVLEAMPERQEIVEAVRSGTSDAIPTWVVLTPGSHLLHGEVGKRGVDALAFRTSRYPFPECAEVLTVAGDVVELSEDCRLRLGPA
jgi:hypothetical protein